MDKRKSPEGRYDNVCKRYKGEKKRKFTKRFIKYIILTDSQKQIELIYAIASILHLESVNPAETASFIKDILEAE